MQIGCAFGNHDAKESIEIHRDPLFNGITVAFNRTIVGYKAPAIPDAGTLSCRELLPYWISAAREGADDRILRPRYRDSSYSAIFRGFAAFQSIGNRNMRPGFDPPM